MKLDNLEFQLSEKKDKKLKVYYNNKWIHFGKKGYQHYFDKLGHYSHLNHLDLKRKQNYYKRFGKKEDAIFESAKYFSHNYLW